MLPTYMKLAGQHMLDWGNTKEIGGSAYVNDRQGMETEHIKLIGLAIAVLSSLRHLQLFIY